MEKDDGVEVVPRTQILVQLDLPVLGLSLLEGSYSSSYRAKSPRLSALDEREAIVDDFKLSKQR